MAWAKQHRERQKWTRFDAILQVVRQRAILIIARPGVVFFVIILWSIFDDFERFLRPWCKQSNTGKYKNERVLMHFCRWSDDVRFWPLQHRNPHFFVFILRWFSMHFGVILHDFGHPFESLISVYECSSEQLKTCNFRHFFKRFLYGKNTVTRDDFYTVQ